MYRLLSLAVLAVAGFADAKVNKRNPLEVREARASAMRNHIDSVRSTVTERASQPGFPGSAVQNITFKNPAASAFFVDGSTIPLVDFDIGPSWAGLLPISAAKNETRKVRAFSLLRIDNELTSVSADVLLVFPSRS